MALCSGQVGHLSLLPLEDVQEPLSLPETYHSPPRVFRIISCLAPIIRESGDSGLDVSLDCLKETATFHRENRRIQDQRV